MMIRNRKSGLLSSFKSNKKNFICLSILHFLMRFVYADNEIKIIPAYPFFFSLCIGMVQKNMPNFPQVGEYSVIHIFIVLKLYLIVLI